MNFFGEVVLEKQMFQSLSTTDIWVYTHMHEASLNPIRRIK